MASDVRKLSDWLLRQSGALQEVLSHTEQLVQVNRTFREWLAEPWAETVRIVAFEGETAVIHATDAATATHLRFREPAVVAFVRERWNPACTKLKIKVQPDT